MSDVFRRSLPVFVLAAVGCGGGDGVRSYNVPRSTDAAAKPAEAGGEVRLLGAIIPAGGENSYFVKFVGPADRVGEYEGAFDAFVNSIKLTDNPGKPLTWTVPPGATEQPPRPGQIRIVTVVLGRSAEAAVSGPFQGTLLANVNRWRKQDVGAKEVTEAELPGVVKEIDLGGTKAYRVDYRGPGGTGGMGGAPFMKGR